MNVIRKAIALIVTGAVVAVAGVSIINQSTQAGAPVSHEVRADADQDKPVDISHERVGERPNSFASDDKLAERPGTYASDDKLAERPGTYASDDKLAERPGTYASDDKLS
jgi:hypothetical protein